MIKYEKLVKRLLEDITLRNNDYDPISMRLADEIKRRPDTLRDPSVMYEFVNSEIDSDIDNYGNNPNSIGGMLGNHLDSVGMRLGEVPMFINMINLYVSQVYNGGHFQYLTNDYTEYSRSKGYGEQTYNLDMCKDMYALMIKYSSKGNYPVLSKMIEIIK